MVNTILSSIQAIEAETTTTAEVVGGILEQEEVKDALYTEMVAESKAYDEYMKLYGIDESNIDKLATLASISALMTAQETIEELEPIVQPTFTEQQLMKKTLHPQRVISREAMLRREITEPLETEEVTRLIPLSKQSITLTEQRTLASLESYLCTIDLASYEQVLNQIINMSEACQLYLTAIQGKQALQRLMLQMYVPMYMESPDCMNMVSTRVTQATIAHLIGKSGTIYAQVSGLGQAHQPQTSVAPVQDRKLETKNLTRYGSGGKPFPTKSLTKTTDYVDKWIPIPLGWAESVNTLRPKKKEEAILIGLMFCTNIPYFIKIAFARMMGYPENIKLYRRPMIHFMPFRITYGARLRRTYEYAPDASWLNFRRDEYLKFMQKYGSRYGV